MAVLLLTWILGAVCGTRRRVTATRQLPTLFQGTLDMTALLKRFVREESGQDLIEYGLLIGIITTGAITAIGLIGPKVKAYYETLEGDLP
jgi:Flp pilus assembly pilin Flp